MMVALRINVALRIKVRPAAVGLKAPEVLRL